MRRSPNRPPPLEGLRVPFVDLGPSNGAVKRLVLERIDEMIERGDFTNGEAVAEFERALAGHMGRQHCVAVSSGLDALRLSLLASGLDRGDGTCMEAEPERAERRAQPALRTRPSGRAAGRPGNAWRRCGRKRRTRRRARRAAGRRHAWIESDDRRDARRAEHRACGRRLRLGRRRDGRGGRARARAHGGCGDVRSKRKASRPSS